MTSSVGYSSSSAQLSSSEVAAAGALSGFITRALTQPLDVLKIRFQLQVEPTRKGGGGRYYGVVQGLRRVVREEGVRALWRGHVAAQSLTILYGAGQFWSYNLLTRTFSDSKIRQCTHTTHTCDTDTHNAGSNNTDPHSINLQNTDLYDTDPHIITTETNNTSTHTNTNNTDPTLHTNTHCINQTSHIDDTGHIHNTNCIKRTSSNTNTGQNENERPNSANSVVISPKWRIGSPKNIASEMNCDKTSHDILISSSNIRRIKSNNIEATDKCSDCNNSRDEDEENTQPEFHCDSKSHTISPENVNSNFVSPDNSNSHQVSTNAGVHVGVLNPSKVRKVCPECQSDGATTTPAASGTTAAMCGGLAAVCGTVLSMPCDVARTRLVAQSVAKYRSLSDVWRQMWRQEGVASLWRGMAPAIASSAPFAAIEFPVYAACMGLTRGMAGEEGGPEALLWRSGLSGAVAGVAAKLAVYPLDVLKKRAQLRGQEDTRRGFGKVVHYNSLTDIVVRVTRDEGAAAWFKGLTPSLVKSALVSGLVFATFEATCMFIIADKAGKEGEEAQRESGKGRVGG